MSAPLYPSPHTRSGLRIPRVTAASPCVIRDGVCETHDVQAEPAWPDAMNPAWVCPVAEDWAAFEQTRGQE